MTNHERKHKLTPLQYHVAFESGTEPPFANEFWDNHQPGIYIDIVSGAPLFSSRDKFDSGTGWPSFTKPIDPEAIVRLMDGSGGMVRTEIRGALSGIHLGHVFNDGPPPSGMRYCVNSAALQFIPLREMADAGYGRYVKHVEE